MLGLSKFLCKCKVLPISPPTTSANTPSREWVESHNVTIQVGNVFKHMRLPEFNQSNKAHNALARLVGKVHGEHDAEKRAKLLRQIEVAGEGILQEWKP